MSTPEKSLVLYKNQPARVLKNGEKLEIEFIGGSRKVRPKDVTLLHPGPLESLNGLTAVQGPLEEAWELLQGEQTNLEELSELMFDAFTPTTAWAAWLLVTEELYFSGTPEAIVVHDEAHVTAVNQARQEKEEQEQAWSAFMKRVTTASLLPEDGHHMAGVVAVAEGRTQTSKVLKELGRTVNDENAHALLLKINYWESAHNPYPARFELPTESARGSLQALPDEERLDLTHLAAFAIDDEGNTDPDDAISLDGDRLWVHVADAAALVTPDSDADLEARLRGANSYLPERVVTMLPPEATEVLGLGLQEISPALSFSFRILPDGTLEDIEITPSLVKVTRLSYANAESQMEQSPFQEMFACTNLFHQRREAAGMARLNLPEVRIQVVDDVISIRPLDRHRSREMVTDAMLAAGEAAGLYALERDIPIPYATQDPPDSQKTPQDLAAMFAFRKQFKRTRMQATPAPHSGLGLQVYARATSPLRRYLDLVVHQQLRASLRGAALLSTDEVVARVGAAEAVGGNVRSGERQANRHWTLVYLLRHPDWQGPGVLVDKRRGRGVVLIPELALETQVALEGDPPLNTQVILGKPKVDVPRLSVSFKSVTWTDLLEV